ncbi:DUF4350 domain-containing protein [Salinadaptatus halalkaliphilus]|uniref:DUF4350 domain-containing protein n=1 Tax=Salinadaptatus halalkaliphilus TaxID=2419781 RepID=A0A4V3VL72_9EURY|nr:DUF4350 domain-containing protein [Salinadaptatus halalkaliphilus]THE64447.1 DUF4350 domain-containing protein [Salinadaptatus halalkaliphilus]
MILFEWVSDGRNRWPQLLVVGYGIVVSIAILIALVTSTATFGPYNYGWDGTSEFRGQVEASPDTELEFVHETDRYGDVPETETVAFVIAPETSYAEDDAERIGRFVEAGGTLVVLENFGPHSDELLGEIGADSRIDGQLLRDDISYDGGPTMPIATDIEDGTHTSSVDQLTLNHATAIEPGDATVLVRTSEFAYLVEDGGEELSENVQFETSPVVTSEAIGDGTVVVVGDPSLLINTMLERPDNARFVENLHADKSVVILDVTHTEEIPPLIELLFTIREHVPLQIAAGLVGIGLIGVLSRRAGDSSSGFTR